MDHLKSFFFAALAAGCAFAAAADNTQWIGADGAALNDAANWSGDAPFSGVSANNMLFAKGTPSDDYTVRLDGDLVSAGTWFYEDGPYRVTYDLGGHTLTFLSAYSDHRHRGVTNIVQNGTIAFTNAAGVVQNVNLWHSKSGYSLFIEGAGGFIGNLSFADTGAKYLTVRDGGSYKGSLDARGAACEVTFTGGGTTADINGGRFNIGGIGWGARGLIADGASVTNISILNVGGYDTYGAVGGASLTVSNATLVCRAPADSSPACTLGGGFSRKNSDGVLQTWASHGNELRLVDGAFADLNNKGVYIGGDWDSSSNQLYVAGPATVLTNAGQQVYGDFPLIAGQGGEFNLVHFTDGARIYGGAISAGGQNKYFCSGRPTTAVTSRWNRVLVDKGAIVTTTGNLLAATRHYDDIKNGSLTGAVITSNVFEFADGGQGVLGRQIVVGCTPAATGNRFVIRDAGTVVDLSPSSGARVCVGYDGASGNGLEILSGGVLTGVKEMNIGQAAAEDGAVVQYASNNYVRIEGANLALSDEGTARVQLGNFSNSGNRLWVGDGATLRCGGVIVRGWGQEVVISNGVLNIGTDYSHADGFRIGYNQNDTGSTGEMRLSFYGTSPRLILGSGNGGVFTNACSFAFQVPAGGYTVAPFESTATALRFTDDSVFSFDLSGAGSWQIRNVPLIRYSGSNAEGDRIVLSDELLANIQAAASDANPFASVKLSDDRRLLTLSVTEGTLLMVK